MRTLVWSVPMTERFRGITVREGMLVEGAAGWGEWSPFPEYDDTEALPWLRAALAQAEGDELPRLREDVPLNITVPAVDPARAHAIVRAGIAAGRTTAKVKVGDGDDLGRVQAVRDALGATGKVRVDVNGLWDVETAVREIKSLDQVGLEYVEQPCRTVEELAEVRRRVDVPIAADESIRRAEDPYRVRELEAADVAVLKVQPLGGVRACLRIAEDIGLPVVVSSALETAVGLGAGFDLARALPELPYACGLASDALFAVPGNPPASPERTAWWNERLRRVRELL